MGIALKIIINHPIQEVEFISYATWGSLWWEFPHGWSGPASGDGAVHQLGLLRGICGPFG